MSVHRVMATLQHYVPQLLLRGFASGRRNPMYLVDKKTGQTFRPSVRNAGCERGFYDPRSQSAVNVDEWMKQAEAEAGSLVVDIRRQGNLRNLTQSDREWLAAFVAIQIVHTWRQITDQYDLARTTASAIR